MLMPFALAIDHNVSPDLTVYDKYPSVDISVAGAVLAVVALEDEDVTVEVLP